MNIKILDSWLREYLKTNATPTQIAQILSLTSLSVEKIEKLDKDYLYELEITTNRPDLFSVLGIAREASAVLPQFGIDASFNPLQVKKDEKDFGEFPIELDNDPKLVNRICAVVMEVTMGKSPEDISRRLKSSDIRSLNNVIDVTNYVMRTLGHPAHVFDFDRLNTKKIKIRQGRKAEKITTLDGKNYLLNGGEIVATDQNNRIVDLLGIMGLENSVVTDKTKRILYFIDNNDKSKIRQASMALGIRTDAAILNEKGIDPNIAMDALIYGIDLFKELADGKQVSNILDIYPNRPKTKKVNVSFDKIDKIIGVKVDEKKAESFLKALGFEVNDNKEGLIVSVPSFRINDVEIEEDLIEEIARIYGYHNLPSILPPNEDSNKTSKFINEFYFEQRAKNAMKYLGFTETYTYSFVSEVMYQGPINEAVEIDNPLTEDFVYMKNSLIPSLLKVVSENKQFEEVKIFEIANIYKKRKGSLPDETTTFSAVLKNENANFYEIKGIIETILKDLGIKNLIFKKSSKTSLGASVFIEKEYLGEIEVLDTNLIDFELNFKAILKYASVKKEFVAFAKFPPIVEDITILLSKDTPNENLISKIKSQSEKIVEVTFVGSYENSKTFHIVYQDLERNLTKNEVSQIRTTIISSLKEFSAQVKE